jgi:hypothetical protein
MLGVAALACLPLAACGSGGNSNETRQTMAGGKVYPTYRYRLTVEVDTPEGLKTGSSVIEVATSKGSKYAISSPSALSYKVRGEAVTVDLSAHGLLFALLRSDESSDWAAGAFEAMAPSRPINEQMKIDDVYGESRARALALKGPQVVPRWRKPFRSASKQPRSGYPMLVRFGDIADRKTVAKVDPDNLAAFFGKGVKLRRITVERTEDAVTTGIAKRFKWWDNYRNKHFDGSSSSYEDLTSANIAARISSGSFSTEYNK